MRIFILCGIIIAAACSTHRENQPRISVTGLDGVVYYEPEVTEDTKKKLDSALQEAQKNFEADPSEANYIWLGRRLAYLSRYEDAVKVFTEGLQKYPDSYRLLRHRGHRYITLRQFDKAIADLQMAASLIRYPLEIEPDGQPNKLNIPLSTVQFNIWYHLGLAHYLKGDYESAEKAYIQCLEVSDNDDLLVATADWLYMTYCRMKKMEEAAKVLELIRDDMKIVENDSYYKRLKMYKGQLQPEEVLNVGENAEDRDLALATQGYGVGNYYLCQGDTTRAIEIFKQVKNGKHFAAFGFIAAEADLERLKP
ncbi:MAG: tetratricopeptide repeat protein [Cyclobacteriaceae bacterium]|nr:tetratricopeptide repeat protein [Cyclobacteriaceae bacterium]MDW8331229.1 tetratricopeptide repeat protein [Cyclobacteriaceae bacterium]